MEGRARAKALKDNGCHLGARLKTEQNQTASGRVKQWIMSRR